MVLSVVASGDHPESAGDSETGLRRPVKLFAVSAACCGTFDLFRDEWSACDCVRSYYGLGNCDAEDLG